MLLRALVGWLGVALLVSCTAATLVADSPPVITTQPVSQTVDIGQTATFTVVGAGTGPLIYQWRKNNASIAGATSASYTTLPVTPADDGTKYVVSVSDSFSGVTSDIVTLSVPHTATSVTTQPVSQTVGIGQAATFTVVGAGTGPLIYQWRKNNASIAGATSASYTTPPATPADDGTKYVVSVSNSFSGATSDIVTLSVPHTATSITTQPVSQTVGIGQAATFTVVGAGTGPLIYQWRKNNASIAGATSASYTTPPATPADDGTKYVVSVSNSFSGVTSDIVTLSVPHTATSITTQPVSQTVGIGQAATFTVVGAGTGPLIYQWRKNNASIAGATSASYTTPPATPADDGTKYVVSVSNSFSGATSDIVTLSVPHTVTSITTQPVSQTVGIGQAATFTVVGAGTGPLIYQWRKNNASIAGATSASYTTPPATPADDGTKYVVSVSNSFSGVTSNTVTLNVGTPLITTQPVSQRVILGDTVTFTVAANGTAPLSYLWFRNGVPIFDTIYPSYSTISSEDDDGARFVVVVSNLAGSATSAPAILSVFIPAEIVGPPQNRTVALGQTATFSVEARGTDTLSYQWQRRDRGEALAQDIPGATSSHYVTPPTTVVDQGSEYTVEVRDDQGNAASASATLTVTPTSPAVYYIDYLTGDDANDGTAKSAPWRHAPGMNGCSGICLITALNPGDQVILKGGINWDSQAFPMKITQSGTSDAAIYYGVDEAWFAGSTWVRPKFDLSGVVFTEPPVVVSAANFVTLDNIEIQNAQFDNFNEYPPRGAVTVEGATGVTVQNCYVHGWNAANPLPGSATMAAIAFFDDTQDGTVEDCTLDGSRSGDTVTGVYGGRFMRGNIIQHVPNAIVIPWDQEDVEISGNYIFDITHSSDPAQNENGIVVWGPARIYNNVIHDLTAEATAVSLQSLSFDFAVNQYVYNNLIWNSGSGGAVTVGLTGIFGSNEFIYNNTIHAGATACVQALPGPFAGGTLAVENNQCISDQISLPAFCWSGAGGQADCGSVASSTVLTNTLMDSSAAVAEGYTIASSFQPMGASSSTVNAGTNLGAACTDVGTDLCSDRLARSRPSGSGAWDTGAYVYQAVAPDQAPVITQEPASNILVIGQAATFSTVAIGSGTLTYQWQKNGADIAGAIASSYTTPPVTALDDGTEFAVVLSNGVGVVTSGVALLSVRNLPGQLSSSPSSVDFGAVYAGISAQTQLAITNTGQLNVTVASVTIAGPGLEASGLPVGTILSPGQAATIWATFTPSSIGSVSGDVAIASDASNSPLTISLSGTGSALPSHGVILSWIASGPDATGYRIYRGTVSGSYQVMDANAQPTSNFADLGVTAGQTYFYVVTVVNSSNQESAYSNEVQVTIPIP